MAPAIIRRSTSKDVCTLDEYNAGKDPFRVVARGIPMPYPYRRIGGSGGIFDYGAEIEKCYALVENILDKYKIKCRSFNGIVRMHRIGYAANAADYLRFDCSGDDIRHHKIAALEIMQVFLNAGIPSKIYNVQFYNDRKAYADHSYCFPDDPRLIGAIRDIQPKVLEVVREQLPRVWTSIAYHMRGSELCMAHERKPTVIVFCKPKTKLNWRMVEAEIASALVSAKYPDVALHLELLPGMVERATPLLGTDQSDHPPLPYYHILSDYPENHASIGVNTKEKLLAASTLGGWVELRTPDGRTARCILTTYDIVRKGEELHRTLNDYNGIGLGGQLPLSVIQVTSPAPMDVEASRIAISKEIDEKEGPIVEEVQALDLLDQLSERGIGFVVHASGCRVHPTNKRTMDWALVGSPSTFRRNRPPYQPTLFNPDAGDEEYKVEKDDFIEEISTFMPGERVTHSGRSSCEHGHANIFKRYIHWGDGQETEEDELEIDSLLQDVGALQRGPAPVDHKDNLQGKASAPPSTSAFMSKRICTSLSKSIVKVKPYNQRGYVQYSSFESRGELIFTRYLASQHKSQASKLAQRLTCARPTFHLFGKLPPEIRLKIWDAARPEPRVVKISQTKPNKYGVRGLYSRAKIPGLLHACHDSRQVALKWYKPTFKASWRHTPAIYFDSSADFAYLSCDRCQGQFCSVSDCGLYWLGYPTWKEAKNLALELDGDNHMADIYIKFRTVEEILFVEAGDGLGTRAEANLSSFTDSRKTYSWQGGRDLTACYEAMIAGMAEYGWEIEVLPKIRAVKGESSRQRIFTYQFGKLGQTEESDVRGYFQVCLDDLAVVLLLFRTFTNAHELGMAILMAQLASKNQDARTPLCKFA
ncbi:hypothetical protein EG329_007982 [Mollisiaceae sp. DMI_Dod_QoI]|nr:hypothetical protein EG329_007982 [Helotiales sp. DMI_Dod_QoI]